MTVCAQPAMSSDHSARVAEAMALSDSGFCKRYRSSYETPSSTLPIRKRYRGTSELILDIDSEGDELGDEDTNEDIDEDGKDESLGVDDERESSDDKDRGLDDEGRGLEGGGLGLEGEKAAPEGQQQAVPVVGTSVSEPLGLGYKAARRRAFESMEEISPSTYEVWQSSRSMPEQEGVERIPLSPEWSSGSLPISPSSPVVPSPIASPVATLTTTISVDEDQFLEVGAQLEIHMSILYDHTQRLDALPPTLIMDIDRDVRELYTRPVLSLEAWTCQTDAQRAALWHAIYDTQRENHDLRMQLAEERRKRLELVDHVARMEMRQESREE
ncbi:hypothetical protein Tco_1329673 [Tanacetum coccineum]